MRYAFDLLSDHPSVVYASGDFKVIAVRSKSGKTRARAVVGYKDGAYSLNRIYGSCNHSVEMFRKYLSDKPTFYGWEGLNLLKIKATPSRGDCYFLCPFIDGYRYVRIYDENYLVIGLGDTGNYTSGNSTSGCVYFNQPDNKTTWASGEEMVVKDSSSKKLKLQSEPVQWVIVDEPTITYDDIHHDIRWGNT